MAGQDRERPTGPKPMNAKDLKAWMEHMSRSASSAIAGFAYELLRDPLHATRWADGMFRSVAEKVVSANVLGALDGEGRPTVAAIADHLTDLALRSARSTARSTSACKNLVDAELAAVRAEIAEKARGKI